MGQDIGNPRLPAGMALLKLGGAEWKMCRPSLGWTDKSFNWED